MSFDFKNIAVWITGLLLITAAVRFFKAPIAWFARLVISCIFGAVLLFLFNLLLYKAGLCVPLNPFNVLTVGVLGLPGVFLLLFLCGI